MNTNNAAPIELIPGEETNLRTTEDLPELTGDEPSTTGVAVPAWEDEDESVSVSSESQVLEHLGVTAGEVTFHDFSFKEDASGESKPELNDHPLVAAVTRIFTFKGHPEPELWLQDVTERFVSDPNMMRELINSILMKALRRADIYQGKDTFQVRSTLDNDGGVEAWLINLELNVIPFMIENELPLKLVYKDEPTQ